MYVIVTVVCRGRRIQESKSCVLFTAKQQNSKCTSKLACMCAVEASLWSQSCSCVQYMVS